MMRIINEISFNIIYKRGGGAWRPCIAARGNSQAQSVKGKFRHNFWYNLSYLQSYLKSCKNLLKEEVRFRRVLHNFMVRFEVCTIHE